MPQSTNKLKVNSDRPKNRVTPIGTMVSRQNPNGKRKAPDWKENDNDPSNQDKNKSKPHDPVQTEILYKKFMKDYGNDEAAIQYKNKHTKASMIPITQLLKLKQTNRKSQISTTNPTSSSNDSTNDNAATIAAPQNPSDNNAQLINDNWQVPKKTLKLKTPVPKIHNEDKNFYDEIDDEVITQMHYCDNIEEKEAQKKQKTITNSNSNEQKKIPRPPPIHVANQKIKTINDMLKNKNLTTESFSSKQRFETNVKIQPKNIESYSTIISTLKENNIEFFTFTPKNQKTKTLVLKGIEGEYAQEDIMKEIQEQAGEEAEITKMSKIKFTSKGKQHYLVQIHQDSNPKLVTRITHLAYQEVKWEFIKKKPIFQCKKCQRLGHSSSNCNMQYRCVKCAQSHEPGKCLIAKDAKRDQLKCANVNKNQCLLCTNHKSPSKPPSTTSTCNSEPANSSTRPRMA